MGMSGSQTKTVQLSGGGLTTRPSISSRATPGTGRNYQSREPTKQEERGLANMLLDSFHTPRVLPPQLAALVALLKTPAAEKRLATGEMDDDPRLAA
jgi:hypothetical protein